jgi:hypothetical protein
MAQIVDSTSPPERQPGPVTLALRAVRNEPEPVAPQDPIAALRAALERHFYGAGVMIDFDAEIAGSVGGQQ